MSDFVKMGEVVFGEDIAKIGHAFATGEEDFRVIADWPTALEETEVVANILNVFPERAKFDVVCNTTFLNAKRFARSRQGVLSPGSGIVQLFTRVADRDLVVVALQEKSGDRVLQGWFPRSAKKQARRIIEITTLAPSDAVADLVGLADWADV